MSKAHVPPQSYLQRATSLSKLKPIVDTGDVAGMSVSKKWTPGRLAVLIGLMALSLSLLVIASGLKNVGDDKSIPAKVRTKISTPISEFAFAITLLSVLQGVAAVALLMRVQPGICGTQSDEVSSALENLDGSRIIKKRDSLSSGDLLQLVHDTSTELKVSKRNEKERREFIAMVTHDLRSPLSSMQGILELLDNGVLGSLDVKGKRLVQNVLGEFNRIQRLIDNMLEIERNELTKTDLDCTIINMGDVVNHAVNMIRVQSDKRNIRINITGLASEAWGDRDQLSRVVTNLLSNAVKFSPDNSIIDLRMHDADDMVAVAVIDSGPGISQDRIERVFDKFERAKLSEGKRGGGTGLGLTICKAIVENHGGNIGVHSKEGVGSEFWFCIPKPRAQKRLA